MITKTIIRRPNGTLGFASDEIQSPLAVFNSLETVLQKHNVLSHPFFQMLHCGGLAPDTLRIFCKQFYHIVKNFPRMVSAVHFNTEEIRIRQLLLRILQDEESGKEHSLELWIRFSESIGVTRNELEQTAMLQCTKSFIETMNDFCRNRSYIEGLASLYAFESQMPELLKTNAEGLIKFYNVTAKGAIKFFTVRQEKEASHCFLHRELIENNVSKENFMKVTFAAEKTAFAFVRFVNGIYEFHGRTLRTAQSILPRIR